jgi:cell filamentation protein
VNDPYTDPISGVLRNRLGITDRDVLGQAEADLTTASLAVLADAPLPGQYDLAHLRAFHRRIFGRIYAWAGEIRTITIAKTDMFCLPQHIDAYASSVFEQLAREKYLCALAREPFVDRLTHYLAEVNAIQPFREGNGRTQRAFFGQLAREAGWPIDWSALDPDENTDTAVASLRGDNRPLRTMLDRLVTAEPRESEAR